MSCRICGAATREILDLGSSPPANWLKATPDVEQEAYPLVLGWCERCSNVQLRDTLPADVLFRDYLYVTPDSTTLDAHYMTLLDYLTQAGWLTSDSFVVEAGSNAGHFLRHLALLVRSVLGVDPARAIAEDATRRGIPTLPDFFDQPTAGRIVDGHGKADLVVARHCLAHNDSPHEMLEAASAVLGDQGHVLIENAYVVDTVANGEFDQVYHEHMFYYSVTSMNALLRMHGMRVVDALLAKLHGGSIVFIAARGTEGPVSESVGALLAREPRYLNARSFAWFARRAERTKRDLTSLVVGLIEQGHSVHSYGATAKGSTLLNYAGLTSAHIPLCVDSTAIKQGMYLPQSNIKVVPEGAEGYEPPDYYLLTAWNYQDEIISKVRASGNRTSRFILPIPAVRIV